MRSPFIWFLKRHADAIKGFCLACLTIGSVVGVTYYIALSSYPPIYFN